MNLNQWLKALLAAFITGLAHGITASLSTMVIDPAQFNLGNGLRHTLELAAVSGAIGAVISAMTYLQKSPLPDSTSPIS